MSDATEASLAAHRRITPWLWWILASSFLLRITAMFAFGTHHNAIQEEMGIVARNLIAGKGFMLPFFGPEGPTASIPPFESSFYALYHYLFGFSPMAFAGLIGIRSALSTATAYFAYRMVQSEFSERLAVLTLLVMAFHPSLIYYSAVCVVLLRPPFSVLVIILVAWSLLHFARHPSLRHSLLTGVVFGLGLMIQSNLFICLPLIWLWMAYVIYRPRIMPLTNHPLVLLTAMPVVVMMLLAPWTLRNYYALGAFVPLRTGIGTHFWLGNNPMATGDLSNFTTWYGPTFDVPAVQTLPPQVLEQARQATEVERDRILFREAWQHVTAYPGAYFKRSMTRLWSLWFGLLRPSSNMLKQLAMSVFALYSGMLIVLTVAALAFRRDRVVGLFLLLIASFTLLYGLIQVGFNYYRMDLEPFCLILTLFTLVSIWEWWQRGRHRKYAQPVAASTAP